MATVRIQVRRGTAAQWTSANPTLAAGELGVESDTNLFKFGNGSSTWTALAYANNSDVAIGEISQDAVNTALTMGAGLTKTYNDGANTITIAVDSAIVTTVSGTQTLTNKTLTSPVINSPTGITKSDVGLANVDNTSDANKPVSTATQTALDLKANTSAIAELAQDAVDAALVAGDGLDKAYDDATNTLTLNIDGTVATKTYADAAVSTHNDDLTNVHGIADTALLATKAYADSAASTAVAGIISTAPATLDTLAELATALGSDANFSSTVTSSIATKLPKAGGTMTGAISMNDTNKITNLAAPTLDADAATKKYVDDKGALYDAAGAAATAQAYADTAIGTHNSDTTNVHGIADTSLLITLAPVTSAISTHNSSTNVHGIADTTVLATATTVATAKSEAIAAAEATAAGALSSHASDSTSIHGIADTALLATKAYADAAVAVEVTDRGTAISTAIGTEVNDRNTAIGTHNSDTTDVHGIANTALLATTANVATAKTEAIADAGTAADTKVSTAVAALTKSSVGLGNVDNTADTAKPVSTAQATAIATAKSEVITEILGAGVPAALNTLDELAAALGDDANFASSVTTSLGLKAPLASPTFTGTVTVAASGIAFTDGTQTKEGVQSRTPIVQKTAAYTLSELTERDSLIEVSSASGVSLTIPTNATVAYPVGTSIDILQTGAGQVTIAGAVGVTVNATPGLKLRTQWSGVTLFKRATDTWVVYGDLTA